MLKPIPEKTFNGRSTARRAAQRALGNPDAAEGVDFTIEARGGNVFVYRLTPARALAGVRQRHISIAVPA